MLAGMPDYVEVLVQLPGPPPGPNFIQGAIDRNGNRTICTFLSSAMWPKMEEALGQLDQIAQEKYKKNTVLARSQVYLGEVYDG